MEFVLASVTGSEPSSVPRILPLTSFSTQGSKLLGSMTGPLAKKMGHEIAPVKQIPKQEMTLILKNGSQVTGEFVSEEGDWITLRIEGGEIGFHRSEISEVVHGTSPVPQGT